MTIYEIKRRTQETAPYFFSKDTMKFFGQNMRLFKVKSLGDGKYHVSAPAYDNNGQQIFTTERIFDSSTNKLNQVK
jgi:hypothetical protein